ncbi:MAG: ligand-binding sensor domain-containing protein [Acidobacteriota bacterium]
MTYRLSSRVLWLSLGLSAVLVVAALWFWWSTRRAAQEVQLAATATGQVDIRSTPLSAPDTAGVTLWLDFSDVQSLVEFRGQLYAATNGGLLVLAADGRVIRQITPADGLPDHALTVLAVFQDRLFIGTRTAGLLEYDGAKFVRHEFRRPAAVHISTLLSTPNYLLIGLLDGSLYDFDGSAFAQRFQPPQAVPMTGITALHAQDVRLYVGTLAQGLFIWQGGSLQHLPPTSGLPSPHVTAFAWHNGHLYVATDAGIARLTQDGQLELVSRQPNVCSLAVYQGKLYAGLVVGGVVEVQPTGEAMLRATRLSPAQSSMKAPRQVRLTVSGERLLALTQNGVQVVSPKVNGGFRWDRLGGLEPRLAATHVTSLAFDAAGRLWVGSFEQGLDILDPETGAVLHHVQDETIREINHLCATSHLSPMLVATSQGIVAFESHGRAVRRYDAASAMLVGNAVSHVCPVNTGRGPASLAVATSKGLTLWQAGIGRSLTAFHGLPSNYLYCCAVHNGKLYVGTLGGLAELDGLRVVRTWRTDNTDLPANWVNALLSVGDLLYIGTYGGGVCALHPNGTTVAFPETKGLEVNLNAMATDGERLYVGTLDRGLLVYDLRRQQWRVWQSGLPSPNVTALAVRSDALFVGTAGGLARIEKYRFE